MREVLHRYRLFLSCGFFLFVSLLLATINARSPYRMDPTGVLFLEVMQPLQVGVTALTQGTRKMLGQYRDLLSVHQTNKVLRARLESLEQMQERLVELELSNQRLELLLGLRAQSSGTPIAARVIGRNPGTWTHTAVLDKGERHGIQKGMAVLTPAGVVGQVVSVGPHASHLLLISAANSGVDALVQRSRVSGIVSGAIVGNCRLKYVQRDSDVEVGDVIITSGLDGVFPKGQQIGRVTRVATRDDEMFQDVEVVLSAELAKIEEVLVVAPAAIRAGAEHLRNE
jgi:rod shape-determining protein MreC